MIYDNSGVRRQDRLLSEERALQMLSEGEYGIMSMVTPDGKPYGIPANFAWDGHDAIYLHCAPEGKKLRCIESCKSVSFTIVGSTNVIARKFTTNYESVILQCQASVVTDDDERMDALRLIINKYAPSHKEIGEKYAHGSFHRTAIIRLTISCMSGKCKCVSL